MSAVASESSIAAVGAKSVDAGEDRLSARKALTIVLLVNLVRLGLSFAFELTPQEAYYFFYSQHLSLSYFDHPPAIAVFLRLFTALFGYRELSLRLAAFTLSILMQLSWLRVAGELLPARIWPRASLLFTTTGMVTVVCLVSTPDVPLLLFWTLALHQLYRAIFFDRRSAWILAGISMGLAFDSKYTGAFLQIGMLGFLAMSAKRRRWLKTPWPYLALGIAHLVMAPVYIWNAQHGFASFLFQTSERAAAISIPHPRYFFALLATQSVLLMPPLLIAVAWLALFPRRICRMLEQPVRERALFLFCFFLPIAWLFGALSLFALVKANWMMPCYLSALLLVSLVFSFAWIRWNLIFSGVIHLLATIQLLFYPVRILSDDTWLGWKELASKVSELRTRYPDAFVFSADGYKTTAELLFYTGSKVYGPNVIGQRGLQFDYVDRDLSQLIGRDGLFVDSSPGDTSPGPSLQEPAAAAYFERCEQMDPLLIRRDDRVLRKFFIYLCRHYRGPSIQR